MAAITETLQVRLHPDLLARVRAESAAAERTLSETVRQALEAYLEEGIR